MPSVLIAARSPAPPAPPPLLASFGEYRHAQHSRDVLFDAGVSSMKLKSQSDRWLLIRRPDLCIDRTAEPVTLTLDQAVEWVRHHRPALWVGSIFSVPEPSGFPSGYAITRSLLEMIFPPEDGLLEISRARLIDSLVSKWPLERLLDEFELLDYDLSESLLDFFNEHDQSAAPNALHDAVVRYYEAELSGISLCVTTNWDTLLEKAFRAKGFIAQVGHDCDKMTSGQKTVSIYHPHGSFETKDVVCSYFVEQQQIILHTMFLSHPMLFLGYSGYEPSLYRSLEADGAQLWCVRNESDFQLPAKRRILCRPNTFVYVGDMQALLKALGVLDRDISFESTHLARGDAIPPKVLEVIRMGMAADMDSHLCGLLLEDLLSGGYDEPEVSYRFARISLAFDNHIRNRAAHPEILGALTAAAEFRNDGQLWYSQLSHVLRSCAAPDDTLVQALIAEADRAPKMGGPRYNEAVETFLCARRRCYKAYLGKGEREDDDPSSFMLSQYAGTVLGDLALSGELAEISAFTCLQRGEVERARGYFDTAATYYYLTGLSNGGKLAEWACQNIALLSADLQAGTLYVPTPASR
jgi:SIR2-like domain